MMIKRGMGDKQGEPMGIQSRLTNDSQALEALRQLESCQPSSQYDKPWMDECAVRLQPLVDQYKPRQYQTYAIEKFRDLIVTTRSCPGDKKNLL